MNLNLTGAVARDTLNAHPLGNGETIQEAVRENGRIIQGSEGPVLTGHVLLSSVRGLAGVYRVWHETATNSWVWVDDEGIQHETQDPQDWVWLE